MLMVIFGAGASFDCVDEDTGMPNWPPDRMEWRPPLAADLFSARDCFTQILRKYLRAAGLVQELRQMMIHGGKDLEVELGRLELLAKDDPNLATQLAALRFYLRDVLWECSEKWQTHSGGATNYAALIGQIERWRRPLKKAVCYVTFNYDTLLERGFGHAVGRGFPDLGSYIDPNSVPVLKPHGSANWFHPVDLGGHKGSALASMIEGRAGMDISSGFEMFTGDPKDTFEGKGSFPALAIPTDGKTGFEFPADHLNRLESLLPHVESILIVGWRAGEQHFLDKMTDHITTGVKVVAVCGGKDHAEATIGRLGSAGVQLAWTKTSGARFSQFIGSNEIWECLTTFEKT